LFLLAAQSAKKECHTGHPAEDHETNSNQEKDNLYAHLVHHVMTAKSPSVSLRFPGCRNARSNEPLAPPALGIRAPVCLLLAPCFRRKYGKRPSEPLAVARQTTSGL